VRLGASTKPPIHNLIQEFLINMAFTMACPNFKKGLKMAFSPLGVKILILRLFLFDNNFFLLSQLIIVHHVFGSKQPHLLKDLVFVHQFNMEATHFDMFGDYCPLHYQQI
jgi:hypothetical protein